MADRKIPCRCGALPVRIDGFVWCGGASHHKHNPVKMKEADWNFFMDCTPAVLVGVKAGLEGAKGLYLDWTAPHKAIAELDPEALAATVRFP